MLVKIQTSGTLLFTNESKFNLFNSDGRIMVWRKPNTELQPQNIQRTVKHGGGGIMVWGCMAASGVGKLHFIEGTMHRFGYLDILKKNLQNSVDHLGLVINYYFLQYNDPKHAADVVLYWLVHRIPHSLKTPPQSAYLNPIENLWSELETRIRKHPFSSNVARMA